MTAGRPNRIRRGAISYLGARSRGMVRAVGQVEPMPIYAPLQCSGRAARFVVVDPAGAEFVLFIVVAALAAIGIHVDAARLFHLAHMVDQILHINRGAARNARSEEHTSELQSLMRTSYAVLCLKNKTTQNERLIT